MSQRLHKRASLAIGADLRSLLASRQFNLFLIRTPALAMLVACLSLIPAAHDARAGEVRHGLSAFGELKYTPGFAHFDYVNPNAPKGGKLSMIGPEGRITFDSFNAFILKGDPAQGMSYTFDSLMVRAFDEPDAVYGLIAHSAQVADDGMAVTFFLREEARFSDGSPVTADDVVFTFDALRSDGHPQYTIALRDVVSATAPDKQTVHYTFKGNLTRDLPLILAGLPVFSKAFHQDRPFGRTTLVPPLGSGPYKIKDFKPGRFVVFGRREDYWARDLNVNRGRFNFDELRYEYFRDRTAELEAIKAGSYDLREEFTSVDWATAYNVPAVRDGRLLRDTISDKRPSGAQGFFINTRLEKFKDVRVREALGLAFDFEWSNKMLFYDLYKRTTSFFENSDMKATGKPSEEELELLNPYRHDVPASVFEAAASAPVSDGRGSDRRLLYKAAQLLDAAGWPQKGRWRKNKDGETLDVEILIFSPSFERIINPYILNLHRIGVNASLRRVDAAQYQRRMEAFDYDLTTQRYSMRLTPGVELKNFWGSRSANTNGSFNLAGISSPVVDALIEDVMKARKRSELVTAARAIDRVLRASYYWVPHWYKAAHNLAYWNKFSRPAVKPDFDRGIISTWWYDEAKAAKLASAKGDGQGK